MARFISRAESFETIHEAFQRVNFNAFDYDTVKQSLLDYVQLYFPESFNDFIESSEFVAILEIFAYISEQAAYRIDLASHENFISTAQRKDSVLRLAKLISYAPTRNIAARGLTKITSVSTTEAVFDSQGENLAGQSITFNDPSDPDWREKFFLVINRILRQPFGSVAPSERVQIEDVLFELYQLENNRVVNGVIPYSASVSGESIPMELVPVGLNDLGPFEARPNNLGSFSILFGNDGLGDGSDTTGFFVFTKQGTLQKTTLTFDGITPNQLSDLDFENVNDTDVFVNNIDPDTGETLDDGSIPNARSGEWVQVDIANAQNIIFNTNTNRNKFEIETLDDDKIRIIFGDGEFANIPSGSFDFWIRTSANADIVIPRNAVVNQSASFSYLDTNNNVHTFTFTFSLINTLQNASPSETIEHIRRVAPSVFFTQDRMVNARDYNTFMLQDPRILKLRAVNRTFAGDSLFIAWHDPSQRYENVKLFGDDVAVYLKEATNQQVIIGGVSGTDLLDDTIEPLLSSTDVFLQISLLDPNKYSRQFTEDERTSVLAVLDPQLPNPPLPAATPVYIIHIEDPVSSNIFWQATTTLPVVFGSTTISSEQDSRIIFIAVRDINNDWTLQHKTRLVAESSSTQFFHTNDGLSVVDLDSFESTGDQIVLLSANIDRDRTGILGSNLVFEIQSHEIVEQGLPGAGLPNIHQLRILPEDTNDDGIPDNTDLNNLIDPEVDIVFATTPAPLAVTLPIPYIVGQGDITVTGDVTDPTFFETTVAPFSIIDVVAGSQTTFPFPSFTISGAGASSTFFPNGQTFRVTGSTGNDRDYVVQTAGFTLGYQEVDVGGAVTGTTATGLDDSTPGTQTVDYSGTVVGGAATGLVGINTYTATITVDGAPIPIAIPGSSAPIFSSLIIAINTALGGAATSAIVGGDILVTSATTGATSTIGIVDTGTFPLFFSTTGFSSILAAVPGTDGTTYTASVVINGGGAQPISVTAVNVPTYADLVTEVQADVISATVALINGNFRITSNAQGSGTVAITDTDLFSSLTLFVAINAAVPATTDTLITVTSVSDSTADGSILLWGTGDVLEDIFITVDGGSTTAIVTVKDYVYFRRESLNDEFAPVDDTLENIQFFSDNSTVTPELALARRLRGRDDFNFLWVHVTPRFNLIDPAATNIIDMFIITRGFFTNTRNFLDGVITTQPEAPSSLELRTEFAELLDNKMISDTVVLHPGVFKFLFGAAAIPQLQAIIKVVRSGIETLTDNEIKTQVVGITKRFFDLQTAEFGEIFNFTELAAAIHAELPSEVSSVVLVPTFAENFFGDLFQVTAREDEIFQPSIAVENVEIVDSLNPVNIRQFPGT